MSQEGELSGKTNMMVSIITANQLQTRNYKYKLILKLQVQTYLSSNFLLDIRVQFLEVALIPVNQLVCDGEESVPCSMT